MTVAVTLFAVLELYKQGELTWIQDEPFGEITITAPARAAERPRLSRGAGARGGMSSELERILESLLFLSPDPVSVAALADAVEAEPARGLDGAGASARGTTSSSARARAAASWRAATRCPATPTPSTRRGGCWRARGRRR